jgi:hypothetical protein
MPTIKGFKGGLFPGKGKKPAALRPSEALVQNSIRDFLNMLGIYNDRLNSGQVNVVTRYTTKAGVDKEYSKWVHLCKKGTPDLFFIFSGSRPNGSATKPPPTSSPGTKNCGARAP